MKWNPFASVKYALGVAVDWRVRDVLEAERQATIELGQTFVEAAAQLTDDLRRLEARIAELEHRLGDGKGAN
jgi:hypothetical protein